jgi:hypothetical protein
MSRSVFLSTLFFAGLVASAFAVAQNTPAATTPTPAASMTNATHSAVKPGDRNYVRDTGSTVPAKPGHCLPVTGRSYTQDDLHNTGERQIGPALNKLDPSITVGH